MMCSNWYWLSVGTELFRINRRRRPRPTIATFGFGGDLAGGVDLLAGDELFDLGFDFGDAERLALDLVEADRVDQVLVADDRAELAQVQLGDRAPS